MDFNNRLGAALTQGKSSELKAQLEQNRTRQVILKTKMNTICTNLEKENQAEKELEDQKTPLFNAWIGGDIKVTKVLEGINTTLLLQDRKIGDLIKAKDLVNRELEQLSQQGNQIIQQIAFEELEQVQKQYVKLMHTLIDDLLPPIVELFNEIQDVGDRRSVLVTSTGELNPHKYADDNLHWYKLLTILMQTIPSRPNGMPTIDLQSLIYTVIPSYHRGKTTDAHIFKIPTRVNNDKIIAVERVI